MFSVTSENQSALESAVERGAELHESRPYNPKDYIRFFNLRDFDSSYPDLCVKYNGYQDIETEASMLRYLYTLACEDIDGDSVAPHVPRPVHCFRSSQHPWGYIVMDRIKLRTVSEQELHTKAAEAIQWLHSKRPPPGTHFGPIGNHSYAYHIIFQDRLAPMMFTGVAAVERYLNTVVQSLANEWNTVPDISITDDETILTQCDIHASNFGVSLEDGRPVIFDAISIQAMPKTLAYFTLFHSNSFSFAVSKIIFTPEESLALLNSPNLRSLAQAGDHLEMIVDDTLGLDEDGFQKPKHDSIE